MRHGKALDAERNGDGGSVWELLPAWGAWAIGVHHSRKQLEKKDEEVPAVLTKARIRAVWPCGASTAVTGGGGGAEFAEE